MIREWPKVLKSLPSRPVRAARLAPRRAYLCEQSNQRAGSWHFWRQSDGQKDGPGSNASASRSPGIMATVKRSLRLQTLDISDQVRGPLLYLRLVALADAGK